MDKHYKIVAPKEFSGKENPILAARKLLEYKRDLNTFAESMGVSALLSGGKDELLISKPLNKPYLEDVSYLFTPMEIINKDGNSETKHLYSEEEQQKGRHKQTAIYAKYALEILTLENELLDKYEDKASKLFATLKGTTSGVANTIVCSCESYLPFDRVYQSVLGLTSRFLISEMRYASELERLYNLPLPKGADPESFIIEKDDLRKLREGIQYPGISDNVISDAMFITSILSQLSEKYNNEVDFINKQIHCVGIKDHHLELFRILQNSTAINPTNKSSIVITPSSSEIDKLLKNIKDKDVADSIRYLINIKSTSDTDAELARREMAVDLDFVKRRLKKVYEDLIHRGDIKPLASDSLLIYLTTGVLQGPQSTAGDTHYVNSNSKKFLRCALCVKQNCCKGGGHEEADCKHRGKAARTNDTSPAGNAHVTLCLACKSPDHKIDKCVWLQNQQRAAGLNSMTQSPTPVAPSSTNNTPTIVVCSKRFLSIKFLVLLLIVILIIVISM